MGSPLVGSPRHGEGWAVTPRDESHRDPESVTETDAARSRYRAADR
jgi:hypothetical protein